MNNVPFESFSKIARMSKSIIVTEKIDGTNAQIYITSDGQFLTGSRNRYITPDDDNFGFSRWAHENKEELLRLGPGRHYGEWWGRGIQRGYALEEKRFSLFNSGRWSNDEIRPKCCHVVPVLGSIKFDELARIQPFMDQLKEVGSSAAPGFMNPEGIVLFLPQANMYLKRTFDDNHKGGIVTS